MTKWLTTSILVLAAVGLVLWQYWDYVENPWTRDGQVRAKVVQVAPRLSAPIIKLPIVDNQFVKAGELLFEIDPRTFRADLDQALANYDAVVDQNNALDKQVEAAKASVKQAQSSINQAIASVEAAEASLEDDKTNYERLEVLVEEGSVSRQDYDTARADYRVSVAAKQNADAALLVANDALAQAQATLAQARAQRGLTGDDNSRIRAAKATIADAELNLEFTEVRASVDGYVTNLNLRLGTQAVANQPALALVDVNSYWIEAYFRETVVAGVRPGDKAVVTLMGYPDLPLEGIVDSLGWGIAREDGSTGSNLLPNVNPTFEWIRLAQRVPVRVYLAEVPEEIPLRIGMTASVLVMKNSAEGADLASVPALPGILH